MRIHYILLSSSYSEGCRIALHYSVSPGSDTSRISRMIDSINALYDGKPVSLSVHVKVTDDDSWDSVVRKDPYFEDVRVIKSSQQFKSLILKDRYLRGTDVADYILTRVKCTHLKLEKLTYLCYADYLCKTGKSLFKDKIYAFQYGPVVDTVHRRYSRWSKEHPGQRLSAQYRPSYHLASKSRILFSEDGVEKYFSIEETLSKYSGYTGMELKDLTHRPGTPWSMSYRDDERFVRICDEVIRSYHQTEHV